MGGRTEIENFSLPRQCLLLTLADGNFQAYFLSDNSYSVIVNSDWKTVMELISINDFALSRSGRARQLVIFAHGDFRPISCCGLWAGDGHTFVPAPENGGGPRLFFYTEHGSSEMGFSILQQARLRPDEAYYGFATSQGLTREQQLEILERGEAITPEALHTPIPAKKPKTSGKRVKNYALYKHEAGGQKIKDHQEGVYPPDVDLLVVTSDTRKHLNDVFALFQDYPYEVYHFAACRVER